MIELRLQPDTEAKLLSQASTRGLDVDHYLAMLVEEADSDEAGFQEGLADIAAGRTRPTDETFAELEERFPADLTAATEAAARIRELRQDCVLAPYTTRELVNEGRRY